MSTKGGCGWGQSAEAKSPSFAPSGSSHLSTLAFDDEGFPLLSRGEREEREGRTARGAGEPGGGIFDKIMGQQFVDDFSRQLEALPYPVHLEHLDPLVIVARERSETMGPRGADEVAGAVVSQLLRPAGTHNKLPLVYLVDAIVRACPEYVVLFSRNLEYAFREAYDEALEFVRVRMLKLLRVWIERAQFDPLLLQRLGAQCDPDYDGPSLAELPPYAAPSIEELISMSAPQPQPTPTAALPTHPPPARADAGEAFDTAALYRRAAAALDELVTKLPPHVRSRGPLSLEHVRVSDPVLFQQLFDKARADLAAVSVMRPLSAPPDSSAAVANDVRALLQFAPSFRPRVPLPPPKGHVRCRAWLPAAGEGFAGPVPVAGMPRPTDTVLVTLFAVPLPPPATSILGEDGAAASTAAAVGVEPLARAPSTATSPSSPDTERRRHVVPKDDTQTRCALTGEEFETFWSDEHQAWMYADAIRPQVAGPIYKYAAWLEHENAASQQLQQPQVSIGGGVDDGVAGLARDKRLRLTPV